MNQKQLTSLNSSFNQRWIFYATVVLVILVIVTLIVLFKMHISRTIVGHIRVDDFDTSRFFVEPTQGQYFSRGQTIIINTNSGVFRGVIKSISFDSVTQKVVLQILDLKMPFTPGVVLESRVVIGSSSLISILTGIV